MELKKLDKSFYLANPVLLQALDFDMATNTWFNNEKVRGHGVVQIRLNELTFAIPVRSTIQHSESFILEINRGPDKRNKGMGLDYSKAVLLRESSHINSDIFSCEVKLPVKNYWGSKHISPENLPTMLSVTSRLFRSRIEIF
ncbi:hypothetical protein [Atlantibacter subterraneus]|uniref:hypothetical protein n=1 Tax=Atlantibacter subterraneus TaxID=255519 RepID=UPI001FCC86A5|nr:hypothetical protein [Atlantibacter subterranea]